MVPQQHGQRLKAALDPGLKSLAHESRPEEVVDRDVRAHLAKDIDTYEEAVSLGVEQNLDVSRETDPAVPTVSTPDTDQL